MRQLTVSMVALAATWCSIVVSPEARQCVVAWPEMVSYPEHVRGHKHGPKAFRQMRFVQNVTWSNQLLEQLQSHKVVNQAWQDLVDHMGPCCKQSQASQLKS